MINNLNNNWKFIASMQMSSHDKLTMKQKKSKKKKKTYKSPKNNQKTNNLVSTSPTTQASKKKDAQPQAISNSKQDKLFEEYSKLDLENMSAQDLKHKLQEKTFKQFLE